MTNPPLPPGFQMDAAPPLPPGFQMDSAGAAPAAPAPPPREVGFIESALRSAGLIARTVVGAVDQAAAGLAGLAGDTAGQEGIFRDMDVRQARMAEAYAPQEGEKFSRAGQFAGGVGMMGASLLGVGLVGGGAERSRDIIQRGGSPGQAMGAGAVQLAGDSALAALPAGAGRALGPAFGGTAVRQGLGGAITGVGLNVPAGAAVRAAENAALPEGEQFADLKQPLMPDAAEVGMTAAMGALGGVGGRGAAAQRQAVAAEKSAAAAKADALEAPRLKIAQEGREANLFLTPSAAGGGKLSQKVEGLAGGPRLEKAASAKNVEGLNALGRRDVGLADDVPISVAELDRIRSEEGQAYNALKGVGTIRVGKEWQRKLDSIAQSHDTAAESFEHRSDKPFSKVLEGLRGRRDADGNLVPRTGFSAAAAVEEVKLLRNDADKAYRAGDKALGRTYRDMAQALDDAMDAHLQQEAKTRPEMADTVNAYRKARTRIAKTYMLQEALNDSSGNIDANVYARELKKNPKLLTGDALTIARFAQQFPKLVQKAERIGSTEGTAADAALGLLGKAAALVPLRPLARSALLTDAAQDRFVKKPKPQAEAPAPTPEPELTAGQSPFPGRQSAEAPAQPLGDLTPDWETAPGAAAPAGRREVVPTEGLVQAVDEQPELPQGVPQRPGSQIPVFEEPRTELALETAPGAAAPAGRREMVPTEGLVQAIDEDMPPARILRSGERPAAAKRAGQEVPAVPGRPGLPDAMVAGAPGEVAPDAATGAAMQSEGAQLARAQQGFDPQPARPEKIPVGEATELDVSDPRLAEIQAMAESTKSEAVKKALAAEAARIRKEVKVKTEADKRTADAQELRTLAEGTKDVKLRQALLDRAGKLEVEDKLPVGETTELPPEAPATGRAPVAKKPLPVGQSTELPPDAPGGQAPAMEKPLPVGEATPITDSGVGLEEKIPVGEARELLPPKAAAVASDEVKLTKTDRGAFEGADKKGDPYQMKLSEQRLGADKKERSILVEAHDPVSGQRRAFVDFAIRPDGVLVAENVKVAPYLKKRGIAELLYRMARESGYDIAPGRVQTDEGLALVEALQRKGVINKDAVGSRAKASDLLKPKAEVTKPRTPILKPKAGTQPENKE